VAGPRDAVDSERLFLYSSFSIFIFDLLTGGNVQPGSPEFQVCGYGMRTR
jgi:hypothetical protein